MGATPIKEVEPAQEILALNALLSNEGSGESGHMHSVISVIIACTHKIYIYDDSDQNLDLWPCWLHVYHYECLLEA